MWLSDAIPLFTMSFHCEFIELNKLGASASINIYGDMNLLVPIVLFFPTLWEENKSSVSYPVHFCRNYSNTMPYFSVYWFFILVPGCRSSECNRIASHKTTCSTSVTEQPQPWRLSHFFGDSMAINVTHSLTTNSILLVGFVVLVVTYVEYELPIQICHGNAPYTNMQYYL